MRASRRLPALLIALAAALGACASNPRGEGGSLEDRFQVTIENNGTVSSNLRITLLPLTGGGEYNVGLMTTVGSETLSIERANLNGNFRLRAVQNTTGVAIHSQPFQLQGGGSVVWDLRRNTIVVRR
ncbi:MAG TPA: hypothetical protein VFQ45_07520 [Longimicrobium sp.]|nr:hypothetical protein [Longimicrobium sp.]